jgi:uncharacterized protein YoxC
MTQRASTSLSLLFLLSSFPLSLGDATQIGGGVSTVSEILDQFFKKQEINGRKPPVWKKEAQAMISLVQSLKDIDPTTQSKVNGYVDEIIKTLQGDVDETKIVQANAAGTLQVLTTDLQTALQGLDSQLTKVKSFSATVDTCRGNVSTQKTEFYKVCTDNDRDGSSASSSSMSLLELGGSCPTECGKPSTADFELTYEAKQTHTCDFEAGETSKECVAKLWGKVNLTRANLTNKYNAWAAKKKQCEDHMDRCATCNPKWNAITNTITVCENKRDVSYDAYCTLQAKENGFCSANETFHTQWATVVEPDQAARVSEYSDLEFIKCIFKAYLQTANFTKAMIDGCPRNGAQEFYTFATPTGELVKPNVDASAVPQCHGTVSHSQPSPLFDMTGLINELKTDGHGATISVADHVYSPDASPSSTFCSVLTR